MRLDTFNTLVWLTNHDDQYVASKAREALETECVYDARLADIGGIVLCGGDYALVLRVDRNKEPIEVVTTNGTAYYRRAHVTLEVLDGRELFA